MREVGPGFQHPSRADVEKALLWEECQGECPYTGKRFPFSSLFGENPPLQVEHIIPFSRIPDDSFQNKTLCYHEENQHKGNRTPFEAYTDPEQYREHTQSGQELANTKPRQADDGLSCAHWKSWKASRNAS